LKKKLKIILPLTLGLFFIYLTVKLTSPQERNLIWNYIKSAKIQYLIAAMSLGAFADIIRGIRWQLLSKVIGYRSNTLSSIASVFMCYTSNMAVPRSGEFVRATVLSQYNKIPIGKTLGTIIAERIIDVSISFLLLSLIWILQYEMILESFFDSEVLNIIDNNIGLIGIFLITMLAIIIFSILKFSIVKGFVKSVIEGFLSLTKLKNKLFQFLFYSSLIWMCYILAFFVIKFSVPELGVIDNSLIVPAFIVGVYSISLSNHGLGVYPLAISIFLLNFGVNTEIGLTYGWLAWSCQAIITLIFGGLSFFVLPLLNTSD
tara:strand:- start:53016 stop:53966 length:951 start_codon:yes stop_codon:yes gene_type:complete